MTAQEFRDGCIRLFGSVEANCSPLVRRLFADKEQSREVVRQIRSGAHLVHVAGYTIRRGKK